MSVNLVGKYSVRVPEKLSGNLRLGLLLIETWLRPQGLPFVPEPKGEFQPLAP